MNEAITAAAALNGEQYCKPETLEYIFNEESLMIGGLVLNQIKSYQTNFLILFAFGVCVALLSGYFFLKFKQKRNKIITGVCFAFGISVAGLAGYGIVLKLAEANVWEEDAIVSQQQLDTLPKPTDEERKRCLAK